MTQIEDLERLMRIRDLERKRECRVITFYQNPNNLQGMITEEVADYFSQIMTRINRYERLMIVLDSKGGLSSAGWRIARQCSQREGFTMIIVPIEAKSVATLIALAADELIMFENAELGPVDPQIIYREQLVSALDLMRSPDPVIKSRARSSIYQMRENIIELVKKHNLSYSKKIKLANRLLLLDRRHASHSASIFYKEAKRLGLPVKVEMGLDIRYLHQFYKRENSFCEHDPSVIIEFYPFSGLEIEPQR